MVSFKTIVGQMTKMSQRKRNPAQDYTE